MSRIRITTALPYVNGVPHLGHMVGCLLPSDVYARFMRMSGHEVLYIGGTDEHGTPSEVVQAAACGAVHAIEVVSGKAYYKQGYCGCEINTFSYHNCVIKSEMQVYLLGWTLIFVWAKVVNNTK